MMTKTETEKRRAGGQGLASVSEHKILSPGEYISFSTFWTSGVEIVKLGNL